MAKASPPQETTRTPQQAPAALRVIVAAGGTAGHLAPAIAVADVLRLAGCEVHFVASSGRRDAEVIGAHGYASTLYAISGLPRRPGIAQLRAIARALAGVLRCMRIVRRWRPDVVLAGGGFVSVPVAIAARLQRVPVVTTEADAHLGLANRISGRLSRRLCTAYPLPELRLRQEVTGRPVAAAFFDVDRAAARDGFGLVDGDRTLVVFGGSGGATQLNEAVFRAWAGAADPTLPGGEPLYVLHVAGRRDYPQLAARGVASDRYRLIEYCEDMPALLAAADLVVCRPGGSVWELAAVGRAALLVPSPNVTADHQTKNASWFTRRGAAVMVEDAGFDEAHAAALVGDLLGAAGDARRAELAAAIHALARPRAAADIAGTLMQCGGPRLRRRVGKGRV